MYKKTAVKRVPSLNNGNKIKLPLVRVLHVIDKIATPICTNTKYYATPLLKSC